MRDDVVRAVRGRLFRSGLRFDDLDLDAFYNAAWASLHKALSDGVSIERPVGFLVKVAYCRAIDEARKTKPGKWAAPDEIEKIGVDRDIGAAIDDRATIGNVQEAMSEVLTDRERAAIALCVLGGLTRPQAADILGETRERMERTMDGAQVKLRPLLRSIENGEWCSRYSPRLRALALGMLDERGDRYAATVGHLAGCPACRAELHALQEVAA